MFHWNHFYSNPRLRRPSHGRVAGSDGLEGGAGGNTHTLLFAQDDSIEVVCVFVRVCVRETEIRRSNLCMALLCAGEHD